MASYNSNSSSSNPLGGGPKRSPVPNPLMGGPPSSGISQSQQAQSDKRSTGNPLAINAQQSMPKPSISNNDPFASLGDDPFAAKPIHGSKGMVSNPSNPLAGNPLGGAPTQQQQRVSQQQRPSQQQYNLGGQQQQRGGSTSSGNIGGMVGGNMSGGMSGMPGGMPHQTRQPLLSQQGQGQQGGQQGQGGIRTSGGVPGMQQQGQGMRQQQGNLSQETMQRPSMPKSRQQGIQQNQSSQQGQEQPQQLKKNDGGDDSTWGGGWLGMFTGSPTNASNEKRNSQRGASNEKRNSQTGADTKADSPKRGDPTTNPSAEQGSQQQVQPGHQSQQLKGQPGLPQDGTTPEVKDLNDPNATGTQHIQRVMSEIFSARIDRTEAKSSFLNTYTCYVVQVKDYGRTNEIERRFDDFAQLHQELSRVCGTDALPPLPEKVMWGSTDAATVEKRKPQLNAVIQACLCNKEALFEKSNGIWVFLDIQLPAVFCIRCALLGYNFISNGRIKGLGSSGQRAALVAADDTTRASNNSTTNDAPTGGASSNDSTTSVQQLNAETCFFFGQLQKLIQDSKYENDRYRLLHPFMLKIVLNLMDGLDQNSLVEDLEEIFDQKDLDHTETTNNNSELNNSELNDNNRSVGINKSVVTSNTQNRKNTQDVLSACCEIICYVLKFSEQMRPVFLELRGIEKCFRVLNKLQYLNPRIRKVFNVMLQTIPEFGTEIARAITMPPDKKASAANPSHVPNTESGSILLDIIADISNGLPGNYDTKGNYLPGKQEDSDIPAVCPEHRVGKQDFLAKLFWLLWDSEPLQDIIIEKGMFILSNLFTADDTLVSRTFAALLLACLLASHRLNNQKTEAAEGGINALIVELEPLVLFGQVRAPSVCLMEQGQNEADLANNVEIERLKMQFVVNNPLLKDAMVKSWHQEITSLGHHQSSLEKIHTCLSAEGNVVSAKIALYVLREMRPKAEWLSRFMESLRPWVIHEQIQGYSEPQCVASEIVLEMIATHPVHLYGDPYGPSSAPVMSANGEELNPNANADKIIPTYIQDGELGNALWRGLNTKLQFEYASLQKNLQASTGKLEQQLGLIKQRFGFQVPVALKAGIGAPGNLDDDILGGSKDSLANSNMTCGGGVSGGNPSDSNIVSGSTIAPTTVAPMFRILAEQVKKYEIAKTKLRQSAQECNNARKSIEAPSSSESSGFSMSAAPKAPALPLGMVEEMKNLGNMITAATDSFDQAGQYKLSIENASKIEEEAKKELLERQKSLDEICQDRAGCEERLMQKRSLLETLGNMITVIKNGGQNNGPNLVLNSKQEDNDQRKLESKMAETKIEIEVMERRYQEFEQAKLEGENVVRETMEKIREALQNVHELKSSFQQLRIGDKSQAMFAIKNKIWKPFRKHFSIDWPKAAADLQRQHLMVAKFQLTLQNLNKHLIKEAEVRQELAHTIGEARNALYAFESQLLAIDDRDISL